MTGSSLKTQTDWNPDIYADLVDDNGLIRFGSFTGSVPTDENRYAVSCILLDDVSGGLYYNDGTSASPDFVSLTSGGSGGVNQLIAGPGISLSPSGGTGSVTITNTGGSVSPGIPFNSVQFNNGGFFAGSQNFTWDDGSESLVLGDAPKFFTAMYNGGNPVIDMGANGFGYGTNFRVDDSAQLITATVPVNGAFQILDPAGNYFSYLEAGTNPYYEFGDVDGIGFGTTYTLNDGDQSQTLTAQGGITFNDYQNSNAYGSFVYNAGNPIIGLGALSYGNYTNLTMNDATQAASLGSTNGNAMLYLDGQAGNSSLGDYEGNGESTLLRVSDSNGNFYFRSDDSLGLLNLAGGDRNGVGIAYNTLVNYPTSPYTAHPNDYYINVDTAVGPQTINLPSSLQDGQTYVVSDSKGNAAVNNITILPSSGGTINGASSYVISTNFGSVTLFYAGVDMGTNEWYISATNSSGGGTIYPANQVVFGDGSTPGGITSQNLYFNPNGVNPVFEAGDIGGDGNGTSLYVDDSAQLIEGNTNYFSVYDPTGSYQYFYSQFNSGSPVVTIGALGYGQGTNLIVNDPNGEINASSDIFSLYDPSTNNVYLNAQYNGGNSQITLGANGFGSNVHTLIDGVNGFFNYGNYFEMLDPSGGNPYFQATYGSTTPDIKFGDLSGIGNGNTYEFNDATNTVTTTISNGGSNFIVQGSGGGSQLLYLNPNGNAAQASLGDIGLLSPYQGVLSIDNGAGTTDLQMLLPGDTSGYASGFHISQSDSALGGLPFVGMTKGNEGTGNLSVIGTQDNSGTSGDPNTIIFINENAISKNQNFFTADSVAGTIQFFSTNTATGAYGEIFTTSEGNVILGGTHQIIAQRPVQLQGYTVSTLPTGVTGSTAYVTDALLPVFGSAVAGGGAVKIPVFFNGTSWIVG